VDRQKDNLGAGTGPADSASHIQAVNIREGDVQRDDVRLEIEDGLHASQPGGGRSRHFKFPLQHARKSIQRDGVIIYEQNARAIHEWRQSITMSTTTVRSELPRNHCQN
jgi:hypothetical protein